MKMTIELENATAEFREGIERLAGTWDVTPEALLLTAAQMFIVEVLHDDHEEMADLLVIKTTQMERAAKERELATLKANVRKHSRSLGDLLRRRVVSSTQRGGN